MASRIVACVGGNFSDCACFLRNSDHRSSLTVLIGVLGTYSLHTSFSIAAMVSAVGKPLVPSLDRASMVASLVSLNIFH